MTRSGPPHSRASVSSSMWRALVVYRVLAFGYAVTRFALAYDQYRHPLWAAAVLAAMAVWSGVTASWYRAVLFRRRVVVLDIGVTVLAVLSTDLVDTFDRVHAGSLTLPTIWSSSAMVAAAIAFGWRGGLAAALVVGAADWVERGDLTVSAMHNAVIMALAGTAIGYVSEIGRAAERTLVRAQRLEAATRERQRLARDIHDGVLQVLAMVQRQGAEIGGAGAELGRMAGEQEAALRALVQSWHRPPDVPLGDDEEPPRDLDLCALLGTLTSGAEGTATGPADTNTNGNVGIGAAAAVTGAPGAPRVILSTPGEPVTLPRETAHELAAAVSAALDNVRVHGGPGTDGLGARAWILIEDEPDAVTVTVRDDGPGIPAGRLEEARASGRLGVAHSIRGRVADVGGTVDIVSVPGQGTEVEFRVPRARPAS